MSFVTPFCTWGQFPAHGDMRPVFSTVEGEEGFFDVGEQAFRGGEAGEPCLLYTS